MVNSTSFLRRSIRVFVLLITSIETSCLVAADRSVVEISEQVDWLIERRLVDAKVAPSALASDSEFLRRVTLDLIGRIPTYEETVAFLKSERTDKRSVWIDDLLAHPSYGRHFATIWREQIVPRDTGSTKGGRDVFSPWLAEQFQRGRGWNAIVTDLLTAEGRIREKPETGFIVANSENFDPQPNLLADATARLFWGIQLRCAECHDHPFASWKEAEFWGTAAFFSRTRRGFAEGKNPIGWTITEADPDEPQSRAVVSLRAKDVPGAAIIVPAAGGKLAGKTIKAKFLGDHDAEWSDNGPFRQRFAEWATSPQHPYFAQNAANRWWAHLLGRGFINPLDETHDKNPPTHPEVLALLTRELIDSDFDLKHVIRVICNTRTYQRSSLRVEGNESDSTLFSHGAVRVMRPEMLYDSLSVVLHPRPTKAGDTKKFGKSPANRPPDWVITAVAEPISQVSRDEFIRFFGTISAEGSGSTVNQGIPQFLRLMNAKIITDDAPGLRRFTELDASADQTIEAMYLAIYARKPTESEVSALQRFVDESPRDANPYSGIFWSLLNSSEFVLNH